MIIRSIKSIALILGAIPFVFADCKKSNESKPSDPPIDIPAGKTQVAVYYFPNWGPVYKSEWKVVQDAKPRFSGHLQPNVPMWGYENEETPAAMQRKIKAAADSHIDAFIFDWYYFDPATDLKPGGKYLFAALEEGYLKSNNNSDVKFSIMWCNHDVGEMAGAVKPATFEALTDYVIEHYFKHPSYWKIDGAPYFSIYEFKTFLQTFGGDINAAMAAIEKFRQKVKDAGFPDLHLNGVLWGLAGVNTTEAITKFNLASTTSYVWIHHHTITGFPTGVYANEANKYFNSIEKGGGGNGLEKPVSELSVPYHPNVTMGWDASPRTRNASDWMSRRDYPFGAVLINNSPYEFKKALVKAKTFALKQPESARIITINAWNEWGEGSYLEPDMVNKMGYLDAVKEVFEK